MRLAKALEDVASQADRVFRENASNGYYPAPLVHELRQLHIALQKLGEQAKSITIATTASPLTSLPVLSGCVQLITALDTQVALDDAGVRQARADMAAHRTKIDVVCRACEAMPDNLVPQLALSFHSLIDIQRAAIVPVDLRYPIPRGPHLRALESPPTSIENKAVGEVISWLDMFEHPAVCREPTRHYNEAIRLEHLRIDLPTYRVAAVGWPLYFETNVDALKAQVFRLFQTPRTLGFVQWALEYARMQLPGATLAGPPPKTPLVRLTSALCDGTISPLHVAAALGLPTLCEHILEISHTRGSLPRVAQASGPVEPSMFALLGPGALLAQDMPDIPAKLDDKEKTETRAKTIRMLLGHQSGQMPEQGKELYAWAAFQAALTTGNTDIFISACIQPDAYGYQLTDDFAELLESDEMKQHEQRVPAIARLLTIATDMSLPSLLEAEYVDVEVLPTNSPDWKWPSETHEAIQDLMNFYECDFDFGEKGPVLEKLDPRWMYAIFLEYLQEESSLFIRRFVCDPRFDKNHLLKVKKGREPFELGDSYKTNYQKTCQQESILSHAVANDCFGAVDALIRSGADLQLGTGMKKRPPIMSANSVKMVEKLVNEHGAYPGLSDADGRSIWHLAAASNDVELLKWLCQNDEGKKRNGRARTPRGLSPVEEAVTSVKDLPAEGNSPFTVAPAAARLLLKEFPGIKVKDDDNCIAAAAITWGSSELVDSLKKRGVDFAKDDEGGRNTLFEFDMSSSPEFILKIQNFYDNSSNSSFETMSCWTPAETFVINTAERYKGCVEGIPEWGWTQMGNSLKALLCNRARKYKDLGCIERQPGRRGCWARFCAVLEREVIYTEWSSNLMKIKFWGQIGVGLLHLMDHGMIQEYEGEAAEDYGRSGPELLEEIRDSLGYGRAKHLGQAVDFVGPRGVENSDSEGYEALRTEWLARETQVWARIGEEYLKPDVLEKARALSRISKQHQDDMVYEAEIDAATSADEAVNEGD